jgi:hypothetical protein
MVSEASTEESEIGDIFSFVAGGAKRESGWRILCSQAFMPTMCVRSWTRDFATIQEIAEFQ